jgi:hypothetical protein
MFRSTTQHIVFELCTLTSMGFDACAASAHAAPTGMQHVCCLAVAAYCNTILAFLQCAVAVAATGMHVSSCMLGCTLHLFQSMRFVSYYLHCCMFEMVGPGYMCGLWVHVFFSRLLREYGTILHLEAC